MSSCTGDFSQLKDGANKFSADELKKRGGDFPEVKTVIEDVANYHSGLTDEFRSLTDDLESGQADKPTAIERIKAQSEKVAAESSANVDASTARVVALIEGLPDDQ
ncbi:hypothetical protein NLG97_g7845 [Lecanicillium saksenae]|uniref:Uncharacterized protein n=1 Tax=Lecanicillium saksenae TaxID=468837 RepID=A0ACC1QPH3_9HYPO|nr:hypothetical protein NLG97_g7845 [Lecanicillium saksenae]